MSILFFVIFGCGIVAYVVGVIGALSTKETSRNISVMVRPYKKFNGI